jgi:hypothetical protein
MLGPELRVERAELLIRYLQRRIDSWNKSLPHAVGVVEDAMGNMSIGLVNADHRRFARISVAVGEIAYNLRSALDYSVHELSRNPNSGGGYAWSQFPIEGSKHWFKVRKTGVVDGKYKARAHYLKGVPDTAIDLIRQLQPCYGCGWTGELADLSNPDKHRHLVALRSTATGRVISLGLDPETKEEAFGMEFDEVDVVLKDHRPLAPHLESLADSVGTTVQVLKRCLRFS